MDLEDIPVGAHFTRTIDEEIQRSDVFLALIGPKWQSLLNVQGQHDDFVVNEIATAITHGILVIPVLLGQTSMPPAGAIPKQISSLAYTNSLRLEPGERFNSDFERLVKSLPKSDARRGSIMRRLLGWFSK